MEYVRVREIIYLIWLHFVYNTDILHFHKVKPNCLCRPLVARFGVFRKPFFSVINKKIGHEKIFCQGLFLTG